nr:MAG TPA: hypothetical protein [Caudoviricetes sp.]
MRITYYSCIVLFHEIACFRGMNFFLFKIRFLCFKILFLKTLIFKIC